MSRIELELWYDSPALVFGSDQKVPEHRAPSIRGQLRYWARAIIGARTTNLQEVSIQESAAFGSTGAGSPIIVRVSEIYPRKDEIGERNVLPDSKFTSKCILENSPLTVWGYSRPAIPVNTLFEKSLTVWLLLGGIGKRSRRMFGSPGIDSVSGFNDSILARILKSYDTPSDYTRAVKEALEYIVEPNNSLTIPPKFPTLHPKYSQVIIGKKGFGSAEKASIDLFNLMFKSYKSYINKTDIFGKIQGGRRASPLIAQVRRIGNQYYPVLTYFYTDDLQRYRKVINNFMEDAMKLFSGEIVWGGEFQ